MLTIAFVDRIKTAKVYSAAYVFLSLKTLSVKGNFVAEIRQKTI